MKIILIGFMGSGKSSVAKKLALLLRWPVLEMDELVLQKTGAKNMHELFLFGGERLMRETELAVAREYAGVEQSMIISTGGGVVLNQAILDQFKCNKGKTFFLRATFQTLSFRLKEDASRPLFENREQAEALFHFRQPLYLNYADHIIETDERTLDEIAHEIVGVTNGQ